MTLEINNEHEFLGLAEVPEIKSEPSDEDSFAVVPKYHGPSPSSSKPDESIRSEISFTEGEFVLKKEEGMVTSTPKPQVNGLAMNQNVENEKENSSIHLHLEESSAYDAESDSSTIVLSDHELQEFVLSGEPVVQELTLSPSSTWSESTTEASLTLETSENDPTLKSSPIVFYNSTTSDEEENCETARIRAKSAVCRQLQFPNRSGDREE